MAIRHGTPPPFWYSPRTVWPGPFGAIMTTSTVGLRLDQAEMHVEAVGEGIAAPSRMFGAISSL